MGSHRTDGMGVHMRRNGIRGKRGAELLSAALTLFLFVTGALPVFTIGDVSEEIQLRYFPQFTGILCDFPILGGGCGTENLTATPENSYISQLFATSLSTNESFSGTVYTPLQTEEINIQVAVFSVEWSTLGNINDGNDFATVMASNSRKFFVNIGGNVVGLNTSQFIVDPVNHTHCVTTTDENETDNGYFCSFPYVIPQTASNRAAAFNAIDVTVTPANHARRITQTTIEPKERPTTLTTTQDIIDYVWGNIKIIIQSWMRLFTYLYYFLLITGGMAILYLLVRFFQWIYRTISGGG